MLLRSIIKKNIHVQKHKLITKSLFSVGIQTSSATQKRKWKTTQQRRVAFFSVGGAVSCCCALLSVLKVHPSLCICFCPHMSFLLSSMDSQLWLVLTKVNMAQAVSEPKVASSTTYMSNIQHQHSEQRNLKTVFHVTPVY